MTLEIVAYMCLSVKINFNQIIIVHRDTCSYFLYLLKSYYVLFNKYMRSIIRVYYFKYVTL